MNIIIPMAGWGTRLRPQTLTVPKPLLPIAGKSIVHRLVENLSASVSEKIEEIAFIIRRDFGPKVEEQLVAIAAKFGAKAHICYQDEQLGTAHAILCARACLHGPIIVAFADTLFKMDFQIDATKDGIIWVKKVADPSAFGVLKMNAAGEITDFVEKPAQFVSDLAIIGIYFFRDGKNLCDELQYLIDHNIRDKGEYQLTNALENMKNKGQKFHPGEVDEWLDCGNKDVTVYTNSRILELVKESENLVSASARIINSVIIAPSYIGDEVELIGSVVGPYASIGNQTVIESSVIRNSIVQQKCQIRNKVIDNSMIGNQARLNGKAEDLNAGDYTVLS